MQREAIAKAVRAGRLDKSRHGERFDFAVALHEWNAGRGHGAGEPRDGTIADERRQWLTAKRRVEEYRLAILEGRYVERDAVLTARVAEIVRDRTMIEGIPSRMKARLPHLTTADLVVMQALLADVLTAHAGASADEGAA